VIDVDGLSEMIISGELRYVMVGGRNINQPEVTNWLSSSCTVIPQFSQNSANFTPMQPRPGGGRQGPGDQTTTLYQCG
jgi:hypothetical protein